MFNFYFRNNTKFSGRTNRNLYRKFFREWCLWNNYEPLPKKKYYLRYTDFWIETYLRYVPTHGRQDVIPFWTGIWWVLARYISGTGCKCSESYNTYILEASEIVYTTLKNRSKTGYNHNHTGCMIFESSFEVEIDFIFLKLIETRLPRCESLDYPPIISS